MSDQEEMYRLAEVQTPTREDIVRIVNAHKARVEKLEGEDAQDWANVQSVLDQVRARADEDTDDLTALVSVFGDPRGGYANDLGDALMMAVVVQAAGFKR